MNRLVIWPLCAFVAAAILRPAVIHADDEGGVSESHQPTLAPPLSNPIPINFEANRLVNVVDYLQNTTGHPIDIDWPELEKWNLSKDVEITLSLTNVPSGRAIELVMHEAAGSRLTILLDGGERLHVTMRRKAEHLVEADPSRWSNWRAEPIPPDQNEPSQKEVAITTMGKTIPWNFEENRIGNIFEYLRNVSNPNIYVNWSVLRRVGVGFDTLVTAKDEPTAASEVFNAVLATTGEDLAWRIDDFGIVVISTREGLNGLVPKAANHEGTSAGAEDDNPPAEPGAEGE